MVQDNTLARSLHDLGLAAWFGGSLMGAVGLNGAAAVVDSPEQRLRMANTGWAPVNLAGIAAHLAGGTVLLAGNKGRLATQRGVVGATVAKAALTGLALGPRPIRERLANGSCRRGRAGGGWHHALRCDPARSGRGPAATDGAGVGDPRADRDGAGAERAHG